MANGKITEEEIKMGGKTVSKEKAMGGLKAKASGKRAAAGLSKKKDYAKMMERKKREAGARGYGTTGKITGEEIKMGGKTISKEKDPKGLKSPGKITEEEIKMGGRTVSKEKAKKGLG